MLRRTRLGGYKITTTWTRPSPRPSSSSATGAGRGAHGGVGELNDSRPTTKFAEAISPVQRCYTGLIVEG